MGTVKQYYSFSMEIFWSLNGGIIWQLYGGVFKVLYSMCAMQWTRTKSTVNLFIFYVLSNLLQIIALWGKCVNLS